MDNRPKLYVKPNAIRAKRLSMAMRRSELADQTHLSIPLIALLETKERPTSVETVSRLCDALVCQPHEISYVVTPDESEVAL